MLRKWAGLLGGIVEIVLWLTADLLQERLSLNFLRVRFSSSYRYTVLSILKTRRLRPHTRFIMIPKLLAVITTVSLVLAGSLPVSMNPALTPDDASPPEKFIGHPFVQHIKPLSSSEPAADQHSHRRDDPTAVVSHPFAQHLKPASPQPATKEASGEHPCSSELSSRHEGSMSIDDSPDKPSDILQIPKRPSSPIGTRELTIAQRLGAGLPPKPPTRRRSHHCTYTRSFRPSCL